MAERRMFAKSVVLADRHKPTDFIRERKALIPNGMREYLRFGMDDNGSEA